jgi:hypothetical protein
LSWYRAIPWRPRKQELATRLEPVIQVTGRSCSGCDSIRFLKLDARQAAVILSAWRLPGTLRMDEEDGRPGPPQGHIIGNGADSAKSGTRQRNGFQDPDMLQKLMDVTHGRTRQTGRADVVTDALADSLCHPSTHFSSLSTGFEHSASWPGVVSSLKQPYEGECHENVPGK